MKPSDILARGQEVLTERGLAQKTLINPLGAVCSGGALALASGAIVSNRIWTLELTDIPLGSCKLAQEAARYLELAIGGCVVPWNDFPGRTLNEVLDKFHEAMLLAKEDGR